MVFQLKSSHNAASPWSSRTTTTLRRGDDERVKLAVGELLDAAATKLRAPALADARIDGPIRAYVGQIFTTLCMRGDWCENEWCDAAVPHLLTLMGESRGHGDACEDALARADEAALAVAPSASSAGPSR